MSSLQFSRARDAELAWVDGQLHMNASESHVGLVLEDGELRDEEEGHEKMETDQSGKEEPMDTVPMLEQLQLSQVRLSRILVQLIGKKSFRRGGGPRILVRGVNPELGHLALFEKSQICQFLAQNQPRVR